jgi:hypothetical protein
MWNIDREHPEYVANRAMWGKYRDLYAGGEQLYRNASEYLIPRHKEPSDIYEERLGRVFYENYIGSIVDWYAATLMRREPVILFEGQNQAGKDYFNTFAEDCDLKGTSLSEFYRQHFVRALVWGQSHIAVEFPKVTGVPKSRAEEDALGRSRAYLVDYSPEEIINWSRDEHGSLDWVVIRTQSLRQTKITDEGWQRVTRWLYYDRHDFKIFERQKEGEAIEVVDQGRHGLAALETVPLFTLRVSEGLWLMNKAALLQLEHFNKSNALAWALTMGLFAMPVVFSTREWKQMVGESYYIQLGPEDRFGWTEPEGKVFQIASDNLVRLKEEIYRVCYLMTQAGGTEASHLGQSGISKQRDFSITQEVLRAYGDSVKESLKQVLRAIVAARQDELTVEVLGLDEFDIGDFGNELDDAKKLLELGIGSETLKKQLFKKLAFKYFCDARQEVKNQIAAEIDGG